MTGGGGNKVCVGVCVGLVGGSVLGQECRRHSAVNALLSSLTIFIDGRGWEQLEGGGGACGV